MREHEGSNKVGNEPCPKCQANGADNSGDNLVRYDDGHGYCFACNSYFPGDGQAPAAGQQFNEDVEWAPIQGQTRGLPHRRISEQTAQLYGYRTAKVNGKLVEVANYFRDGVIQAQHVRFTEDKDFIWRGNAAGSTLFGQHLWRVGGKRIVVTEGEIDAMSIAEAQGRKWPVVSLPGGAAGAVKAVRNNYEFLSSYKEIILCFDMDEAGKKAAQACAAILPPGRVKIAHLPRKDANEMLLHAETAQLLTSLWEAQAFRPDGILHASEIQVSADLEDRATWPLPWDGLNEYLIGQRAGEITMWTSGTGSGKSTIVRELVMDHLEHGRTVGMLMLEESPEETMDDLISLRLNKPVRRIRAKRALNRLRAQMGKELLDFEDTLTEEEYLDARSYLSTKNLYIYDSFGMSAADNIVSQVDYMATALGCDVVILDHITAAVANVMAGDGPGKGEREAIDEAMHNLRGIVTRTGCHLDVISQLRKPAGGVGYEEGARIRTADLRGSGSLSSVPNTIIAMERNRQAPNDIAANTSILRVLKNRYGGDTGVADALFYNRDTGKLQPQAFTVNADGDVSFGDLGDMNDDGSFAL